MKLQLEDKLIETLSAKQNNFVTIWFRVNNGEWYKSPYSTESELIHELSNMSDLDLSTYIELIKNHSK